MKFQTSDIRDGLTLSFDKTAQEFDEIVGLESDGIRAIEPGLSVQLRVERVGDTILVRGSASAVLSAGCVRCLKTLTERVDADVDVALFPRGKQNDTVEELELSPEDLDVAFYDEPEVDVSDIVREAILLELPSYPAHEEGDAECVPLSVEEALEDRVDPRWAALAAYKDEMGGSSKKPN